MSNVVCIEVAPDSWGNRHFKNFKRSIHHKLFCTLLFYRTAIVANSGPQLFYYLKFLRIAATAALLLCETRRTCVDKMNCYFNAVISFGIIEFPILARCGKKSWFTYLLFFCFCAELLKVHLHKLMLAGIRTQPSMNILKTIKNCSLIKCH